MLGRYARDAGNQDNYAPDNRCDPVPCPSVCDNVFSMVHISYVIRGGTRIMWTLHRSFVDPQPWVFRVETGRTGNEHADDWVPVGNSAENICYVVDTSRRSYTVGETDTHYRVRLTTPNGVYFSQPTAKSGVLNARDWRNASEILRRERLRNRYASSDGFLLKRRTTGQDCTTCLDPQTREVTDIYCPTCRGTGKVCGYYYPIPCIWADLSSAPQRRQLDGSLSFGVERPIVTSARMSMLPLVEEQDIWINRKTDERYAITNIRTIAAMRSVPLVANVEMRLLPFTDIVYEIPIPQQDEGLTTSC